MQTRDRGKVEEKESWVDSLGEVETMEGGELVDDEEERAEAGEVEKERGVMPEDEEVRAGRWRRRHFSAVTVTRTIVFFISCSTIKLGPARRRRRWRRSR